MGFTYSGDPSASQLDAIRFLVGDVDPTDVLLQDGELTFLLNEEGTDPNTRNVYFAAAAAAEQIAGNFAREVNFTGDNASSNLGDLQDKFNALALRLRWRGRQMSKTPIGPYAGGTSYADINNHNNDMDAVKTFIGMGMHDNIRIAGADEGVPGWDINALLSEQSQANGGAG